MSTDSGFKIMVGDTALVDLTGINATAADVKLGKKFVDKYGEYVEGTYTVPTQEKEAIPSTSGQTVTPDTGKYLSKVTVNPISTQEKTITPSTSSQAVMPDTGKYLSKVTINPILTEEKTITPSTSEQIATPGTGKHLSKVTVSPILTQEKTVTPSKTSQTVMPDTGKYLSKVIVNPILTEEITVSPSWSSKTVTPKEGEYLSKVTISGIGEVIAGQVKTVRPLELEQTITPDTESGYYFLSQVNVGGIGAEMEELNELIGGGF